MYCLISEFIVGRLLSLIEKIISLVMWWFVRMKMEKITDLVEQLENLKKRVAFQESQKDNQFSTSQAVQVKAKCVEIFQNFENTFSFLILIVFTFLLCSFFKIIFLFAYGIKIASYPLNYLYLIDFTSHSVLVIAMVLSADNIQERVNHINLMFSTQPNSAMDFSKQYLDILRNRASLSLTGWGMFTVRKPLLLSMLTWLFTYAVIILQFFYTPSN
ncbi:uncharacterized protein CEXT_398651 [Caerostris extrusa]|uniref:Gustatory receptor n=1 Tax=Caerostris extrusa TaxID=172846 RepID=A0AAV4V7Q9_CAEEX|nr:uncharacterized protein CEXT_398651 [Caerostris extrusa]